MTIWRMRIACSVPKGTSTHSEYAERIAILLWKWLQEGHVSVTLHVHCVACRPVNSVKPAALNCQWSLFYHIRLSLLAHISTKVVVAQSFLAICVCVCVCVALAPDSCVKNSIWKIAAFGNPCFERICSPACKFLNGMEFLFSWRQWNDYNKDRPPRHRFFLLSLCVWVNAEMVLGSCDRTSWGKCEERGKSQQDARIRCVLLSSVSQPHNRYQPHPAEPAQYTVCSNTVFVLLKMGIMMPETCWDRS